MTPKPSSWYQNPVPSLLLCFQRNSQRKCSSNPQYLVDVYRVILLVTQLKCVDVVGPRVAIGDPLSTPFGSGIACNGRQERKHRSILA